MLKMQGRSISYTDTTTNLMIFNFVYFRLCLILRTFWELRSQISLSTWAFQGNFTTQVRLKNSKITLNLLVSFWCVRTEIDFGALALCSETKWNESWRVLRARGNKKSSFRSLKQENQSTLPYVVNFTTWNILILQCQTFAMLYLPEGLMCCLSEYHGYANLVMPLSSDVSYKIPSISYWMPAVLWELWNQNSICCHFCWKTSLGFEYWSHIACWKVLYIWY